jgi:hypothetical protein
MISASTPKHDTHEDTYSAKIINSFCRVPPNLHINYESRVEALKCYKPVFANRLGHPVFFDFSKDYLWLTGDTVHIRLDHFLDSSSLSKYIVKESQLIRNELKNLIFTQSRVQLGFMQTEMQRAHILCNNINEFGKLRCLNMLVLNKYLAKALRAVVWTYLRELWTGQHTESLEQLCRCHVINPCTLRHLVR